MSRIEDRHQKILKDIRALPANKKCMDCSATVSECREFSHKVKSPTMSSFKDDEIKKLQQGGNDVAQNLWRAKWKQSDFALPDANDASAVREFIRLTYIDGKWKAPAAKAASGGSGPTSGNSPGPSASSSSPGTSAAPLPSTSSFVSPTKKVEKNEPSLINWDDTPNEQPVIIQQQQYPPLTAQPLLAQPIQYQQQQQQQQQHFNPFAGSPPSSQSPFAAGGSGSFVSLQQPQPQPLQQQQPFALQQPFQQQQQQPSFLQPQLHQQPQLQPHSQPAAFPGAGYPASSNPFNPFTSFQPQLQPQQPFLPPHQQAPHQQAPHQQQQPILPPHQQQQQPFFSQPQQPQQPSPSAGYIFPVTQPQLQPQPHQQQFATPVPSSSSLDPFDLAFQTQNLSISHTPTATTATNAANTSPHKATNATEQVLDFAALRSTTATAVPNTASKDHINPLQPPPARSTITHKHLEPVSNKKGRSASRAEQPRCPVCDHRFSLNATNDEINHHVDNCLANPNQQQASIQQMKETGEPWGQWFDLSKMDWYYGAIDRAEAERILFRCMEDSFLVRKSSIKDAFALSLYNHKKQTVNHTLIEPRPGGYGFQDNPRVYPTILDLITKSPECGSLRPPPKVAVPLLD